MVDDYFYIIKCAPYFESYDITLDFTEQDYENIEYRDFIELAEYNLNYQPVDSDGERIVYRWYTFNERGRTYYEIAASSSYVLRTTESDPREVSDYGTLRVVMDLLTTDNSIHDFRNYYDADETFTLRLSNTTNCFSYMLTFNISDIQKTSISEGGDFYIDVLLPSGEYFVLLENAPFSSFSRADSSLTLVRSDRLAYSELYIYHPVISGTWRKIQSSSIAMPVSFLIAVSAVMFKRLFKGG